MSEYEYQEGGIYITPGSQRDSGMNPNGCFATSNSVPLEFIKKTKNRINRRHSCP